MKDGSGIHRCSDTFPDNNPYISCTIKTAVIWGRYPTSVYVGRLWGLCFGQRLIGSFWDRFWGRFGVHLSSGRSLRVVLGSVWGRFGVDLGVDFGSCSWSVWDRFWVGFRDRYWGRFFYVGLQGSDLKVGLGYQSGIGYGVEFGVDLG